MTTTTTGILFINAVTANNIINSTEGETGVNITGAGQPGAMINLTFDNGYELPGGNSTEVDGEGNWLFTLTPEDIVNLGAGRRQITVKQTAGNSVLEVYRTFTIDAPPVVPMAPPVFNPINDASIVEALNTDTPLPITGTGKAGATLTLDFVSGLTLRGNNSTVVDTDGNWSIDITSEDISIFALGGETLRGSLNLDGNISDAATEEIVNTSGFRRLLGDGDANELAVNSNITDDIQVFGLAGDDRIEGTTAPSSIALVELYGGTGNDTVIAGNNQMVYGNDGHDTLLAAGSIGGNTLDGGVGEDTLIVVEGRENQLFGGVGDDVLRISDGGGFNILSGGIGNDDLDASHGVGNNQLFGDGGDDTLRAGAPTDKLFGGVGDDELFALNGGILSGGEGANTFFVGDYITDGAGATVITDFKLGGDRLVITGIANLTEVIVRKEGSDTLVIANTPDEEISLVRLTNLNAREFVTTRDVFWLPTDTLQSIDLTPDLPLPINVLPPSNSAIQITGVEVIELQPVEINKITADIPGAEIFTPLLSFTIIPLPGSTDQFTQTIQQISISFDERPLTQPDYNTYIKRDENGDFFPFNFNAETGLGAVLQDRDNNSRIDSATLFLQDNQKGDLNNNPGLIFDPGVPAVVSLPPSIVFITDSSSQSDDQFIRFGTNQNGINSDLVRLRLPDTRQYVEITNNGTNADLVITGTQVNVPNVTLDYLDYNFATEGNILLNPTTTQRLGVYYAPSRAGESFDIENGLVIVTSAGEIPVRLVGKSTFNSDINYDGFVSFADLGPLNSAWNTNSSDANWNPTADINGDGFVSFGDLGLLNAEWGSTIG